MGRHRSRRIRRGILIAIMGGTLAGCTLELNAPTAVSQPPSVPTLLSGGSIPSTLDTAATPGANLRVDAAAPASGPTPISAWRAGAHRGTILAPTGLLHAGTLTVGSDVSYPPQEYFDGAGHPVGFDMDIADEIASRLGLTLTVVNTKFDDIILNLNNAQFDLVLSALTITPESERVVQFIPYFSAGQAVLVATGNPEGIHTLEDLAGKVVATEQGKAEEDTLRGLNTQFGTPSKPKVTVLSYPTDSETVEQLRQGWVVATLHDSSVAAYYAARSPAKFAVAIPAFAFAPQGIGVAEGNSAIFQAVTAAVQAMQGDGTMDAIKSKWGLQ